MVLIKALGDGMDLIDMTIKDFAQGLFIKIGLSTHQFQGLPLDDKGDFHGRVMPLKGDVTMSLVVTADGIGKLKGHRPYLCLIKQS